MTCACTRLDPRTCYLNRYGLEMIDWLAPEDPRVANDEACDCDCHAPDVDDELDDCLF